MDSNGNSSTSSGISTFTAIGVVIAVLISWGLNHSVLWALFHGMLSWFYVIYRVYVGVY